MEAAHRFHQNRNSVYIKQKVCEEILTSEENYVKQLNLVIKIFEEPLRSAAIIPAYVVAQIFGNLSQLIGINEELLAELREFGAGAAFKNLTPYLKLYATYARGHERALKTLIEWEQKNQKLAEFRRKQEEREELSGLKLNALLITPVQRIPRYRLLLEQLLKSMDTSDEDYNDIKAVCEQVTALAEFINNHIKSYDNTQRMLEIQKRLEGRRFNLVEPGRLFIREGLVKKVTKDGSRSQERMLFLFSDMLMYTKFDLSGKYSGSIILPLHKCAVSTVLFNKSSSTTESVKDKSSNGGFFKVSCLESQVLFYASRLKDVETWVEAISSAIGEYREDRRSLRKESSGKRPQRCKQLAKQHRQASSPLADQSNMTSSMVSPQTSKPMKRAMDAVLGCTPVLKRKKRRESLL